MSVFPVTDLLVPANEVPPPATPALHSRLPAIHPGANVPRDKLAQNMDSEHIQRNELVAEIQQEKEKLGKLSLFQTNFTSMVDCLLSPKCGLSPWVAPDKDGKRLASECPCFWVSCRTATPPSANTSFYQEAQLRNN